MRCTKSPYFGSFTNSISAETLTPLTVTRAHPLKRSSHYGALGSGCNNCYIFVFVWSATQFADNSGCKCICNTFSWARLKPAPFAYFYSISRAIERILCPLRSITCITQATFSTLIRILVSLCQSGIEWQALFCIRLEPPSHLALALKQEITQKQSGICIYFHLFER